MKCYYELERRVHQLVEEINRTGSPLFKDTTIKEVANVKMEEWARETEYLEGISPFAIINDRPSYRVPEDYLEAVRLEDVSKNNLTTMEHIPVARYANLHQYFAAGFPELFNLWRDEMRLWPVGKDSSASTTVATFNIDIADTVGDTIILADSSGFQQFGWMQIEEPGVDDAVEILQYDSLVPTGLFLFLQ